jgi:MSHA biogenesis protein MshI
VFEVPNQGRAGRPPLVYVVAARAQPLREMVERVRAAGLNLWKIDVAELALRNLVETAETGPETVAGLYLMPERGMLQITRGDLLYLSRSLDYGLDAWPGTIVPPSMSGWPSSCSAPWITTTAISAPHRSSVCW